MPVTTSGAISLEDVQTEFGGSNPIGIEEYYRGGSNVPDITANIEVSASGMVRLDDFYGTRTSDSYSTALYNVQTVHFWQLCGYSSWVNTPNNQWFFVKTTNSYSKSINVPYNNFALSIPAISATIRADNADQGKAEDDWSGIRKVGIGVYDSNNGEVEVSRSTNTSYNSEVTISVTIPALSVTLSAGDYHLRWIADLYRNDDDADDCRFNLTANQNATWVSA